MTEKIRVDVQDMTLEEMAETLELAGDSNSKGFNFRQTAAMVCVIKRRTDPEFTYEQALKLKLGDLDIVNAEEAPEALGGATGVVPPLSLASGTSTPNAS